ncbi:proton-associated sugar transporter A-like [Phlebotomus papatasi]|uniref:proton-associated sugar transporter A-like n=1 Tax=Phlebotomus papatasi TaxID=29031 RepID=UPI0024845FF0|nr:proton-associated sugar transporter A-like [Phlebotomus papatasi]
MIFHRIKWIFFRRKAKIVAKDPKEDLKKHHQNFSHIFRRKSQWELIRLSFIMMGIELAYAAETAFVSPILLNIGINHRYMTMVWSLSACLGIVCSPFIGPLTDQCRLSLGRRRPLIIFLSVLLVLGLILVPHGQNVGLWLEGQTIHTKSAAGPCAWAIFLTVLGTIVLDFSADNCQTPSRAYLLDMCLPADHTQALSTFSIMSGVGSFVGYAMCAYDWEHLTWTHFLGNNISAVFAIVVLSLIVCVTLTLTTFREIPLSLLEDDEELCPVMNVSRENQVIEEDRRRMSFGVYLRSIVKMPWAIKMLCLMSLFGWMSDVCYSLYFTDFVGEAVFRGDPGSDSKSEEHALYESGVRFGCWGMSIYAFSCIIFSIAMESLIKTFRTRTILIGGSSLFGLSMICLATWPTKVNVLLLSISAGINFAIVFTIPFILIAQYHSEDTFKNDQPDDKKLRPLRGLGTDIAIVNSSLFLAQVFVSLTIGSLVSYTGSTSAVIYAAGIFSLCAAIVGNRIIYLD